MDISYMDPNEIIEPLFKKRNSKEGIEILVGVSCPETFLEDGLMEPASELETLK